MLAKLVGAADEPKLPAHQSQLHVRNLDGFRRAPLHQKGRMDILDFDPESFTSADHNHCQDQETVPLSEL